MQIHYAKKVVKADKIRSMLQVIALVELFLCWVLWASAFMKPRKQAAGREAVVRAPSSKWGIGLQVVGSALIWMYVRPADFEKSWPTCKVDGRAFEFWFQTPI